MNIRISFVGTWEQQKAARESLIKKVRSSADPHRLARLVAVSDTTYADREMANSFMGWARTAFGTVNLPFVAVQAR